MVFSAIPQYTDNYKPAIIPTVDAPLLFSIFCRFSQDIPLKSSGNCHPVVEHGWKMNHL
jgi:hypothetical protein